MTYRSILVYLDAGERTAERTRIAIGLAGALDAHLAGVAPTGLVGMPMTLESAALMADYAGMAWDALRAEARGTAAAFEQQCRAAGTASFEVVVDEADKAESLVMHAQCADLTIVGQSDPNVRAHREAAELVEQVMLYSARPTLVVPYAGRFEKVGTRALVAWDGGRESVRALADALPLLRRSVEVQVVTWNEPGAARGLRVQERLDALRRWLMWQGVSAEVGIETTTIPIADALLSRAADMSADLIVMGAYGHARWTERMLGGATRGLLAQMTVPVLMSH